MKKKHLIIAALSLALVSGCGAKEPTTTATTQATTKATTTEATTEEAYESQYTNESDRKIDEWGNDVENEYSFLIKYCFITEDPDKPDEPIVSVTVKSGIDFPTACMTIPELFKTADHFGKAYLMINWKGDNGSYTTWDTDYIDGYEKGILTSSNSNPISNVTPEEIQKAYSENQSEGGD
jgi:hypothetical protein